jgi:AcrR family transcriptional regulator
MPRKHPVDPLAPRKAPLQRRSAATVEAILEAAARILETAGFGGYTTNAVAQLAGVSIGSLYQYFPNRDALTAALIERETAGLLIAVRAAQQLESCTAILEYLTRAAVEHQMNRPALARIIDFEERRLPLHAHHRSMAVMLQQTIVDALQRPDAPRVAHPEVAAQDVLAITRGIVDVAGEQREADADGLQRRVYVAVTGYLSGIAADAAGAPAREPHATAPRVKRLRFRAGSTQVASAQTASAAAVSAQTASTPAASAKTSTAKAPTTKAPAAKSSPRKRPGPAR